MRGAGAGGAEVQGVDKGGDVRGAGDQLAAAVHGEGEKGGREQAEHQQQGHDFDCG